MTNIFQVILRAILPRQNTLLLAMIAVSALSTAEVRAQDDGEETLTPTENAESAEEAGVTEEPLTSAESEAIPEGEGNIVGQVFDAESGDYVSGVTVLLVWPDEEARELGNEAERDRFETTNNEGKYRFVGVPAGVYTLRFVKSGYRSSAIRDLKVLPNEAARGDFPMPRELPPTLDNIFELEEFEIGAEALSSQNDLLADLRREAAGTVDFLSSEDFAKFGGTDLSDLVQRLPGVNVVGGKFAVVRGLGDRYNSTLVNGLPMPSPDPVRQGLQLDLFPTSIIENVITNKSFLPNMPSNSSGAAFELNTKSFPDEPTAWGKAGFRFNSLALSDEYLKDPNAGSSDYWANGKSNRQTTPDDPSLNQRARISGMSVVAEEGSPPIGLTFSAGGGNTYELDNGRNLGFIASASYDSSYSTQIGTQQNRYATNSNYFGVPPGFPGHVPAFNTTRQPGSLFLGELGASGLLYDTTSSDADVLIGMLGGLGYEFDKAGNNKIVFNFLFSQSGNGFAERQDNGHLPSEFNFQNTQLTDSDRGVGTPSSGNSGSTGLNIIGRGNADTNTFGSDTLSYEQRNVTAFQLGGELLEPKTEDLTIFWGVTYAKTSSDLPQQTVFNSFYDNGTGSNPAGYFYDSAAGIGGSDTPPILTETSRSIDDETNGGRLDANYEFDINKRISSVVSGGGYWSFADRHVDQVDAVSTIGSVTPRFATREELFDYAFSTGSAGTTSFPSFADARRKEIAGYFMGEFSINDDLSFTGGARVTKVLFNASGNAQLTPTRTLDQFLTSTPRGSSLTNPTNGEIIGFTDASVEGDIDKNYILPGATVSYDFLEDWNVRLGYAQTVAYPSFRELSPYFSRNLETGDTILGNPTLGISQVENFDVRVQYDFDTGFIALGSFYKTIEDPIEQIVLRDSVTGRSIQSFFNNPNTARIKGIEVEMQTSLDFLSPELEYFSIGANYTYIDASVGFPENVLDSYFTYAANGNIQNGSLIGTDGPPYGNNNLPTDRRLFDQPEWLVNANLTFNQPDWGTAITIAVFSQSDVLTAVGSGLDNSVDQYTKSYYQLDLTLNQNITDNLVFKFQVTNITNTARGIEYVTPVINRTYDRTSYNIGQSYRFAIEYTF
ncbi:TonB-dependent receptor [Cerasicoccus frondis]|uniref:TonB-dependent receptor n=1 Tax=Cerasicoccus frondis TaxID=490090 RepID=UPI002852AFC8|nr:TonB-dependent receptor [Cerasicoccus frondis]